MKLYLVSYVGKRGFHTRWYANRSGAYSMKYKAAQYALPGTSVVMREVELPAGPTRMAQWLNSGGAQWPA